MKRLTKSPMLRLAVAGFLITAILGLAVAGFLATRFKGEIMSLEDVSQASPQSSEATADGLPALLLVPLSVTIKRSPTPQLPAGSFFFSSALLPLQFMGSVQ